MAVIRVNFKGAQKHISEVTAACVEVRQTIADATTVADAYVLWDYCKYLTLLLEQLTHEAAARVDRLSEDQV